MSDRQNEYDRRHWASGYGGSKGKGDYGKSKAKDDGKGRNYSKEDADKYRAKMGMPTDYDYYKGIGKGVPSKDADKSESKGKGGKSKPDDSKGADKSKGKGKSKPDDSKGADKSKGKGKFDGKQSSPYGKGKGKGEPKVFLSPARGAEPIRYKKYETQWFKCDKDNNLTASNFYDTGAQLFIRNFGVNEKWGEVPSWMWSESRPINPNDREAAIPEEAYDKFVQLTKEPSRTNLADLFTKELDRETFLRMRGSIGVLTIA